MPSPRETLVAELRERGITYLAPSDAKAIEAITSDEALIMALLDQPETRLQLALVPLFIKRPKLAEVVSAVVEQISLSSALTLQMLYMAAVYLQRWWYTRLSFYLDDMTLLPDLYSRQLNLPAADERFGKVGLCALAEAWTTHSVYPFDHLAAINKTMTLFFEELKLEQSRHEPTPAG